MIIVEHRRNTIDLLRLTPKFHGTEIDIRSNGLDLIIQHDPFKTGTNLESWLKEYSHELLILNVKEEGLEDAILLLMKKYKIKDYFFLDQSFPFLIKTANNGESRLSVRFSEFESLETVLNLQGLVDWIWIDYFSQTPLNKDNYHLIKKLGFKICLVSPELQGYSENEIIKLKRDMFNKKIIADAVCTKKPELWF